MTIYLVYEKVKYQGNTLLGVYGDAYQAEHCVGKYLAKVQTDRQLDFDELIYSMAAEFCVEEWDLNSTAKKSEFTLTSEKIKELWELS